VKEPFSWPNSSLSISSPGIAAQFTFTKGPAAKGLFGVDVRGQQFLAGARFADEQHAGIGAGGHGGLLDGALEGGAGADHFGAGSDGFAQALVFLLEGALFERILDGDHHAVAAQRLFEKIEGAGAGGFHGIGDGGVAGDHDDGAVISLACNSRSRSMPLASGSRTSMMKDRARLRVGKARISAAERATFT
jgi:hypothetical protein